MGKPSGHFKGTELKLSGFGQGVGERQDGNLKTWWSNVESIQRFRSKSIKSKQYLKKISVAAVWSLSRGEWRQKDVAWPVPASNPEALGCNHDLHSSVFCGTVLLTHCRLPELRLYILGHQVQNIVFSACFVKLSNWKDFSMCFRSIIFSNWATEW